MCNTHMYIATYVMLCNNAMSLRFVYYFILYNTLLIFFEKLNRNSIIT
jgi:hypothetical protein